MIALQRQVYQKQPAINIKALSWTIGIHALLLLLFFLWHYTLPVTVAAEDTGMEVNLGTSDNGSGTDQPMSKEDPSEYQATVVYKNTSHAVSLPKDMMQSADADAPTVNNTGKKKNETPNTEDNHAQRQPRYVYPGDKGMGGNTAMQNAPGTNEGDKTGPGDRGVPNGTPGASAYSGTPGSGTGGMSFPGRQIFPAVFEAEFHEGGIVVIHVTVDKNGNITINYIKRASSPQLQEIAIDKLRKAHFSKAEGGAPEQSGDVTIIFKTRS